MTNPNERAAIGNNSASFDAALNNFDLAGFALVRLETLVTAVTDARLDRACLGVLAALITTMNRETRTSWAGRDYIAGVVGISTKSVSNYLNVLRTCGYVASERRPTPDAGDRVLMHYTLAKLNPTEIEDAITRAVTGLKLTTPNVVPFPFASRGSQESSRQDGNSVPVGTGTGAASSRRDGKSVPVGTGTLDETSRQDGNSLPVGTGTLAGDVLKNGVPVGTGTVEKTSNVIKSVFSGVPPGRELILRVPVGTGTVVIYIIIRVVIITPPLVLLRGVRGEARRKRRPPMVAIFSTMA